MNQNAIGIGEILLRAGSSAPVERGAQTGHRAAMSYPRLVGDAYHPQAEGEEFADQIIFFVVEGSAAEVTNRRRVIDGISLLVLVYESAFSLFPDTIRDHVHRTIERDFLPCRSARRAIFHLRLAPGMR